jgi:hypothetical protein
MLITLIVMYLDGWLAVTCAAWAVGRRRTDRVSPPGHPLMVSFAAGAVWPLLVVGLVELSSIMVLIKVQPQARIGTLA